jgi:hypothetical protein
MLGHLHWACCDASTADPSCFYAVLCFQRPELDSSDLDDDFEESYQQTQVRHSGGFTAAMA